MRKACESRAEGESFTSFSHVLPTSQVGYHASKPIEGHRKCGLLLLSKKLKVKRQIFRFSMSLPAQ